MPPTTNIFKVLALHGDSAKNKGQRAKSGSEPVTLQPLVALDPPVLRRIARRPLRNRYVDRHIDQHSVSDRADEEEACGTEIRPLLLFCSRERNP